MPQPLFVVVRMDPKVLAAMSRIHRETQGYPGDNHIICRARIRLENATVRDNCIRYLLYLVARVA